MEDKMKKNNRKYAVIFAPTANIGDDIQTLAAINFLEKKGITEYEVLDREQLSNYSGDEVNLVMNGWFMYNVKNFPPSDKIKPIWLSFHVSDPRIIEWNIDYFKKQPPIGCRDQATVDLFNKHDIDAYFTGCLTLFFPNHVSKGQEKYIVDVNTSCHYIPNLEIDMNLFQDFKIIEHDAFKFGDVDITKRLSLARELLDKYKNASLVVTTRLHCALPCRSLGTDCVFLHARYNSDPRFKGLENILNGDVVYHENKSDKPNCLEEIQRLFKEFQL